MPGAAVARSCVTSVNTPFASDRIAASESSFTAELD